MKKVTFRRITQYYVELDTDQGEHIDFMGGPGNWMRLYGSSWEEEYDSEYTRYLDNMFSGQT